MFPVDEDDNDADIGALLAGSLAVPVSTYCMMGSRALPKRVAAKSEASNGEICENLFFLGKRFDSPALASFPPQDSQAARSMIS